MTRAVLEIEDLRVEYAARRSHLQGVRAGARGGRLRAVDDLSLDVRAGERFGLVGESGSGKSTLARAILGLTGPLGRTVRGSIRLDGVELLDLPGEEMRRFRLARVSLIPQGAMNSLNPVMRIGDQMALTLREHGASGAGGVLRTRVGELLGSVGIDPGAARLYPHQLSGGMKQRVCIAIAVSLRPQLVIADEPTSALDVIVQKRIVQMLSSIQADFGTSVVLIGHDMGLMAQFAGRIGTMYCGRLVEVGGTAEVFERPVHPYTKLLIASVPRLDRRAEFKGIPGMPPSLVTPPAGCPFHPRCPLAEERCRAESPRMREVEPGHRVACFAAGDPAGGNASKESGEEPGKASGKEGGDDRAP
jgi:peptide/nickel transport system ATP-binding protein